MTQDAISSSHNPQFRALKLLADSAQQRRGLAQTLLDGEHLIDACLTSGRTPRQLLVADAQQLAHWQSRCPHVPVLVLSEHLLAALSPVKTPSGVMALIDIPAGGAAFDPDFAVLLERIQDPGNLGAMLRSAAAAGVDTVYLSAGCADAWSPKVLR